MPTWGEVSQLALRNSKAVRAFLYREFQVVQQKALTRLLIEKEIFTGEESLEMVRTMNLELNLSASGNFWGGDI